MAQQTLFAAFPHTPNDVEIRHDIANQGYAAVPFEIGKSACQELFSDFRDFVDMCSEPKGEELKDSVTFKVNERGNGAYFLNYRKPGEINPHEMDRAPGKDHKYIFHFSSQTIDRATESLGGALPSQMDEFLDKCQDMYMAGWRSVKIGASVLGLTGIFYDGWHGNDVHHLRLIDYVASDEPLLGEAHFDRSVATLAITESNTGLRGAPGQNGYIDAVTEDYIEQLRGNLVPVSHFEHEAKFFLAAGVNRLPEAIREQVGGLPLLGHDITNDRPGESRQSAVMFLNPHNDFRGYTVPTKYETGFDDILDRIRQKAA